jgi:cholesterol oxidase
VNVLGTKRGPERTHPTWIPAGNDFGRRMAKRTGGVAANVITEVTVGSPITAHILGGCSFGPTPEEGVIDERNRVRGYANMIVCDGSQIPENLGVNPALSITAFAERAMSFVPAKKPVRHLAAEKSWGLDGLLTRRSVPSRGPQPPSS